MNLKQKNPEITSKPEGSESRPLEHKLMVLAHILFWCAFSYIVFSYAQLKTVYQTDPRFNHRAFGIGMFSILCLIGIMAFLVVVKRGTRKNRPDFKNSPIAVNLGAFMIVVGYISFITSIWPVYSFMSVPMVTIFATTLILCLNFVPSP